MIGDLVQREPDALGLVGPGAEQADARGYGLQGRAEGVRAQHAPRRAAPRDAPRARRLDTEQAPHLGEDLAPPETHRPAAAREVHQIEGDVEGLGRARNHGEEHLTVTRGDLSTHRVEPAGRLAHETRVRTPERLRGGLGVDPLVGAQDEDGPEHLRYRVTCSSMSRSSWLAGPVRWVRMHFL